MRKSHILVAMGKAQNTLYRKENFILISILKRAREYRKLTQAELALLLGMDQSYVSKYENFIRKIDCIELFDICHVLELSIQDVFMEIQEEMKNERLSEK